MDFAKLAGLTTMKNYESSEIIRLIERFEAGRLPKSDWTHEAHLVVAIWYCSRYDLNEAFQKVKTLIISHNESVGTPNTDTEGYHETITRFWLIVACAFIEENVSLNIEECCNAFINSAHSQSKHPTTFYSEDRLFSTEARRIWMEPDLKAIV